MHRRRRGRARMNRGHPKSPFREPFFPVYGSLVIFSTALGVLVTEPNTHPSFPVSYRASKPDMNSPCFCTGNVCSPWASIDGDRACCRARTWQDFLSFRVLSVSLHILLDFIINDHVLGFDRLLLFWMWWPVFLSLLQLFLFGHSTPHFTPWRV